jgi:hypothetical protein
MSTLVLSITAIFFQHWESCHTKKVAWAECIETSKSMNTEINPGTTGHAKRNMQSGNQVKGA